MTSATTKTTSTKKKTAKKQQNEGALGAPARIRIKIRAYDNKVIDRSARQIVDTAERYGAKVVGPIPLPTEIKKYTVNRSTFVHKTARDQYEMRVHKRLIDIEEPSAKVVDSLMNLNLPAGVDIEVKM